MNNLSLISYAVCFLALLADGTRSVPVEPRAPGTYRNPQTQPENTLIRKQEEDRNVKGHHSTSHVQQALPGPPTPAPVDLSQRPRTLIHSCSPPQPQDSNAPHTRVVRSESPELEPVNIIFEGELPIPSSNGNGNGNGLRLAPLQGNVFGCFLGMVENIVHFRLPGLH